MCVVKCNIVSVVNRKDLKFSKYYMRICNYTVDSKEKRELYISDDIPQENCNAKKGIEVIKECMSEI